ncbi:hypothetical protein H9P43_006595 [Blastocladiella emersonii ATCC 22665]|nr:hypothetical protein H9P43_006595 [Blastocladiella emersonii ATCC 22665]
MDGDYDDWDTPAAPRGGLGFAAPPARPAAAPEEASVAPASDDEDDDDAAISAQADRLRKQKQSRRFRDAVHAADGEIPLMLDSSEDDYDAKPAHRARFAAAANSSDEDTRAGSDDDGPRRRRQRKFGNDFGDDNSDDSDDDRERARRRAAATKKQRAAPPKQQQPRQAQPPKPKKNFGVFAGTGGLGLKLMMKMGYTPGKGLGTKEEGIVEPVEAVLRPRGAGIAYDDWEERAPAPPPPPAPKTKDEDGAAMDVDGDDDAGLNFRFARGGVEELSSSQSRRNPRGPARRNRYKKSASAIPVAVNEDGVPLRADLPAPDDDDAPAIDLRGNAAAAITTGPLANLLDHLAGSAADATRKMHARRARRAADLERVAALRAHLDAARDRLGARTEQTRNVETAVAVVRRQASGGDWVATVKGMAGFAGLAPLAAAVAVPRLWSMFVDWDPWAEPDFGAEELAVVRSATAVRATSAAAARAPDAMDVDGADDGAHRTSGTWYEAVLWNAWIPRVRAGFQQPAGHHHHHHHHHHHGQPTPLNVTSVAQASVAAATLQQWSTSGLLTPTLAGYLANQVVLPCLRRAVEAWSPHRAPTTESGPLAPWLLPWLAANLLPTPADLTFACLGYKLGAALDAAHASPSAPHLDAVPASAVSAWRPPVLSDAGWSAFVSRHLVPLLTAHAARRIVIDPSNQDPVPVDQLLAYHAHAVVPPATLAAVLVGGGVLAKWTSVLHAWLTQPGANFAEIAAWFRAWRDHVPRDVLEAPPARAWLGAALDMMRRAVQGEPVPAPEILVRQVPRAAAAAASAAKRPPPPPQAPPAESVTFKAMLERDLDAHELALAPTGRTLARVARPVYRVVPLGARKAGTRRPPPVWVFWDQDVVFLRRAPAEVGEAAAAAAFDENEDDEAYWDPIAARRGLYILSPSTGKRRPLSGVEDGGFLARHVLGDLPALLAAPSLVAYQDQQIATLGPVHALRDLGGAPGVVIGDPRALYYLCTTRPDATVKPPEVLRPLAFVAGRTGMFAIEGDVHRLHRRILNPVFNLKTLKQLVSTMHAAFDELQAILDSAADAGASVDFQDLTTRVTLNVIGRTALATDFDALRPGTPSPLTACIATLMRVFQFEAWNFFRDAFPLLNKLPVRRNRELRAARAMLFEQVEKIVREAARADRTAVGVPSLFSALTDAVADGGEEGKLSPIEMRDELLTFLAAGHETTANLLGMIAYFLAKHSYVQAKLAADIARAGTDSEYLGDVVNETLRVHSPPFSTMRQAAEDLAVPLSTGETLHVPKGLRLFYPIQATHNNPAIWGPDALAFRPERWSDEVHHATTLTEPLPAGKSRLIPPYGFLPFLGGAHACIGRAFALMQVKLCVVRLVSRYEILLADAGFVPTLEYTVTARAKELPLVFKRRSA